MAPAIGRPALDNGSCGSIPGDWVALPPQNIQESGEITKEQYDQWRYTYPKMEWEQTRRDLDALREKRKAENTTD